MKVIRIVIQDADRNDKKVEVKAREVFSLFCFDFAVHRPYTSDKYWSVSECSTGLLILGWLNTRAEAIEKAIELMKKVGEVEIAGYINQALETQKKNGIA